MVRTSRNTIKKYLRIWNTLGMSYEEFCEKSDEELFPCYFPSTFPLYAPMLAWRRWRGCYPRYARS
jgi:hypothetical protein